MPRAGLTRARVVAEAADVADEVGLERLTLAAVAGRLGVTLPSLYKHIRGLDGLHRDLSLLGLAELTDELTRASVGTAGREALHAIADAYRSYAHRRPGLVRTTLRAPDPEDAEAKAAAVRIVEVLRAALRGYHLDEPDVVDAIRCLRAAMHGYVTLEAAGGLAIPQSVDATFDRLIDALDLAYAAWSERSASASAVPLTAR